MTELMVAICIELILLTDTDAAGDMSKLNKLKSQLATQTKSKLWFMLSMSIL